LREIKKHKNLEPAMLDFFKKFNFKLKWNYHESCC
jgi:hypothetical protein